MSNDSRLTELVLALHDIGAFKFGEFKLKSGIMSPVYIDLRIIVSHPSILKMVAELMWNKVKHLKFDVICGVPYTALPMATAISTEFNVPMVMRRKEAKKYGTKKIIEGSFKEGQKCLVIEDLVTSGISITETTEPLADAGLTSTDVVVLVDREQGGRKNIKDRGLELYAVITISDILRIAVANGRITEEMAKTVRTFIANNQISGTPKSTPKPSATPRLPYAERSAMCKNPAAKNLLRIIDTKKTNLCFSIDLTDPHKILAYADAVGPHICLLKTHIDIVENFTEEFLSKLLAIAKKHNFLIFEDRKFADIGSTVVSQYAAGVHKPASWSQITNCHVVPGPGIIDGLKSVGLPKGNGLLLIAEMSSKGNLATGAYTAANVEMALANQDFVIGFIAQNKLSDVPTLITMTPGVQMKKGGDGLGQQYDTPFSAFQRGTDVIIVGRAIYGAANAAAAAAAAKTYRDAGWDAYEQNLRQAKL